MDGSLGEVRMLIFFQMADLRTKLKAGVRPAFRYLSVYGYQSIHYQISSRSLRRFSRSERDDFEPEVMN